MSLFCHLLYIPFSTLFIYSFSNPSITKNMISNTTVMATVNINNIIPLKSKRIFTHPATKGNARNKAASTTDSLKTNSNITSIYLCRALKAVNRTVTVTVRLTVYKAAVLSDTSTTTNSVTRRPKPLPYTL